jgi:predicted dehydrogenase
MIKAARDHGVVLMEAMRPTVTPNFLLLQKNLPRVGTVRRYFASYCQYSSRYDKLKEGVVLNAWRPELGNGSTMDIGVYTLYPMVVLFGRPRSVHADAVMLSTGVDGQCVVTFVYDGFQGTAVYGKIADSFLPTEIQGESGNIIADRIHVIKDLKFIPRAPDRFAERHEEALAVVHDHHEFFYEVQEFCNLVIGGKLESENNSLENSLIIMECIDEIRKQIGLVYPADSADIPE